MVFLVYMFSGVYVSCLLVCETPRKSDKVYSKCYSISIFNIQHLKHFLALLPFSACYHHPPLIHPISKIPLPLLNPSFQNPTLTKLSQIPSSSSSPHPIHDPKLSSFHLEPCTSLTVHLPPCRPVTVISPLSLSGSCPMVPA